MAKVVVISQVSHYRDLARYYRARAGHSASCMLNTQGKILASLYKDDVITFEKLANDYDKTADALEREGK